MATDHGTGQAQRSLDRIIQMQYQADFKEYHLISAMLDQCADALEVLSVETIGNTGTVETIQKRIEGVSGSQQSAALDIYPHEFMPDLIEKIRPQFAHRQVQLQVELEKTPPIRIPLYFNAGGKGMDLLRIEIFSEQFGFDVNLVSERCRFIPLAKDECPGRISLCGFCSQPEDCFQSGSSTFTVVFPVIHPVD
jgi:hypothetical protein